MPIDFQTNLIAMTIPVINEESIINRLSDQYEMKRIKIILYGLSATDYSVDRKAKQLQSLGFTDIYKYNLEECLNGYFYKNYMASPNFLRRLKQYHSRIL